MHNQQLKKNNLHLFTSQLAANHIVINGKLQYDLVLKRKQQDIDSYRQSNNRIGLKYANGNIINVVMFATSKKLSNFAIVFLLGITAYHAD